MVLALGFYLHIADLPLIVSFQYSWRQGHHHKATQCTSQDGTLSPRPSVTEREPYIRGQAIRHGTGVSRNPEHFDKIQNFTSAEDPAGRDYAGSDSLIHRSPATTQGVRAQPHVFIPWLVQSMAFDHQNAALSTYFNLRKH